MATTNFSNGTVIQPEWLNDVDAVVYDATVSIPWTTVTWSGSNVTHSGNHTWSGNMTINGNTVLGNAAGDTLTVAPSAVTWSNNPTHSGNHTFSGTITLGGSPVSSPIVAGQYTPTLTNVANITTSAANSNTTYTRIGNVVTVAGTLTMTPTANTVATTIDISLPIASSLSSSTQLSGGGRRVSGLVVSLGAGVTAETTGDTARMTYLNDTDSGTSRTWAFQFQYIIA